jgi:NAD(P)-dependent dehydrogenase (short-subunit alcohol dehydrogenase family)
MEDVEGKVAVVTGAASGIGRAMADRFAAAGMQVVLADIEKGPLDDAVAAVTATGAQAIGVPTDVSDPAAVEALRDAALERFGGIHVACNNAGVGTGGRIWEQTLEDWQWVLGVNLWGVVHGVRTFVPVMLRQGEGHIVNTASMAGLTSPPMMGIYNVTKHSVVTLSETLFAELAMEPADIGVSVLCPGWVQTRINDAARNRPGQASLEEVADDSQESVFREVLGGLLASGLAPADVADQVFEAVRTKRFYVLTHPDWKPMISNRVDNIVNERDPQSAFLPDA